MTTGLPALFRQSLGSISTMLLNQQARIYGDPAVAAMSIVGRISVFIFAVGLGIAQGYQPMAGFNYGAQKYDRVKKGFRFTLIAGEALLGILAAVGIVYSKELIGVFRNDAEVIAIGSSALVIQGVGILFLPLTVCANVLFQSAGRNLEASFTAIMRSGLFFIPLIIILPEIWGMWGIKLAQPLADIMACLATIPFTIRFYKQCLNEKK